MLRLATPALIEGPGSSLRKIMGHLSGGALDEDILQTESLPPVIPPPPKRGVHWVFVGPNGIRAGWGVLLFVVLFIGFAFLTAQVLRHLLPPLPHSAVLPLRRALLSDSALMVPLLLATGIMALIERRSL